MSFADTSVTIAEMGVYCQAWVAHSHDSQLKKASVYMVAMKHWMHMYFHNNFKVGFMTTSHNRLLFTSHFFDVINIALLSVHNRIHNRRNIYYIITVIIITLNKVTLYACPHSCVLYITYTWNSNSVTCDLFKHFAAFINT